MLLHQVTPASVRRLRERFAGPDPACRVAVVRLVVHTVEARVVVEREAGADPIDHFVLRTLDVLGVSTPAAIDSVLHLKAQVVRQLLSALERGGLVRETEAGFELTPQGVEVARTGRTRECGQERRVFHFLHPAMQYLPLSDPKGSILRDLPPQDGWAFDAATLAACATSAAEWKRDRGFPAEVVGLVEPGGGDAPPGCAPAESALIVDKAQEALCVVALTADAAGTPVELAAHGVSQRGQFLAPADRPLCVLRGPEAVSHAVPQLLRPPARDAVLAAWSEVAALNALQGHEGAEVRFDGAGVEVRLAAEQVLSWATFLIQADHGEQVWLCRADGADLIVPFRTEPADAPAAGALETVRRVVELDEARTREPGAAASLVEALEARVGGRNVSRALAELAWRMERYAAAYALAELEDMADADDAVPLR